MLTAPYSNSLHILVMYETVLNIKGRPVEDTITVPYGSLFSVVLYCFNAPCVL